MSIRIMKETKMERRSEKGSGSSEIRSAIEGLSETVKVKPVAEEVKVEVHGDHTHDDDAHYIPIKPFLSICNSVLQVLDRIGPTMAVLRQDVYQNIQRLETLHESDPSVFSNLVEIVKKEVNEGTARKGSSCSKAIVWLTRSLDFTVALLQKLARDPGQSVEKAVEESYNTTLKPWHRWISSAAFRIALKLVPDNETFIGLLMAKDENYETLKEDMQTLILLLVPFLEEIHSVLRFYSLDRIKAT
ncbi:glycolipid transfer protein 3 isoform X2 [Ziziphus jujuba]|uniref:Glycolipid transfer protein 3 isoform X2 n=1 Tax=Ziziphus jujuba TaxID=326968 RepID=A0A6P4ADV9_ZIZJJ|nr:glycolipid transfer protein 3 isoform X2 [Ziziphus jujuba]